MNDRQFEKLKRQQKGELFEVNYEPSGLVFRLTDQLEEAALRALC